VFGAFLEAPELDLLPQPFSHQESHLSRQLLANRKGIVRRAIENLSAELLSAGTVEKANRYLDLIPPALHGSLQERSGTEEIGDAVPVQVTVTELADPVAGHNREAGDAGELIDQRLGEPIGEILERSIVAPVLEVEGGARVGAGGYRRTLRA